jgi:WD40 repeat protein
VGTSEIVHRFPGEEVRWSPDGSAIATRSSGVRVRIFDAGSGAELHTCAAPPEYDLGSGLSWSPDGARVAGAVYNGVQIWDARTGDLVARLGPHRSEVNSVAWSPDGRRVVCGSEDGTARVWDVRTGAEVSCFDGHEKWVNDAAWSADGRHVASAGSDDLFVRVWDGETGKQRLLLSGHEGDVACVAWSPEGRYVASASWDRTVRVWDLSGSVAAVRLRGHEEFHGRIDQLDFSPDGRRVATGAQHIDPLWFSKDWVRLWDVGTGLQLGLLAGAQWVPAEVAWSPDGKWLVTGAADGSLRVWDSQTGEERHCF